MSTRFLLPVTVGCYMLTGGLLTGCTEQAQKATPAEISSIQTDTIVYLQPNTEHSPACRVSINFMYLKPTSVLDSVSPRINLALQKTTSTLVQPDTVPSLFVRAVQNKYISNYQRDLKKLYEADVHNGVKPEDIPQWYNYEYDITTNLKAGRDSIWNYSATTFQNTGGAHPNTLEKWVNIDAATGKVLQKADVFRPDTEQAICNLILKQLLKEVNQRLQTDTITSLEGLQEAGVLLDGDLFVPDNFFLGEDGVHFLYNRYDIAPYSMGDFRLTVPYAEIETYLLTK